MGDDLIIGSNLNDFVFSKDGNDKIVGLAGNDIINPGTGYDIAGLNKANPSSMRKAIYSAIEICKNRKLNNTLEAQALKKEDIKENRSKNSLEPRNNRGERKYKNKRASNE